MKSVVDWPPLIEEIRVNFPGVDLKYAVFAWGDTLYNPAGSPIPDHLWVHEETHTKQQKAYGSVEDWWKYYLVNAPFRLSQEVEAYHNQYEFVRNKGSRQVAKEFLKKIAKDLSGPLYGRMCSFNEAKELIKNGSN